MITIISPHIDDAVLSLGGIIARLRKKNFEVTVQYVFNVSSWTNPQNIGNIQYDGDISAISSLRESEEREVAKILGYSFEMLNFGDTPLRDTQADEKLFIRIKQLLKKKIEQSRMCLFPLGIDHADHIFLSKMGFEFRKEGYPILFYEDLPYAAISHYDYRERYNFNLNEMRLSPHITEISLPMKYTALKEYRSQVSGSWLKNIMNYSYNLATNSYYERLWIPSELNLDLSFMEI